MHFLSEEFIAGAVVLLGFVFFQIVLWSKVAELKGDIDLLERQIKDKADKWELELTDRTKQLHNEKLEALEVHLGIRFVETPKHLVVKNILEK
jgi:hypothetical protein